MRRFMAAGGIMVGASIVAWITVAFLSSAYDSCVAANLNNTAGCSSESIAGAIFALIAILSLLLGIAFLIVGLVKWANQDKQQ